MSEAGRKDFTDKATEKLTPQSQKSTLDKAQESATGAYDSAAKTLQPDSAKSGTQEAGDKLSGATKGNSGGEGVLDKAKGALGMNKQ